MREPLPAWKDFELAVHRHFDRIARAEGGSTEYDVRLDCSDGEYQMDVVVRLPVAPPVGELLVLVDAKLRERITRDDVLVLDSKVSKCGADVGVLVGASRLAFQRGAVTSAEADRIRLWTFTDGRLDHFRYQPPVPPKPSPPTVSDLRPAIVSETEKGWAFHSPEDIAPFLDDLRSFAP